MFFQLRHVVAFPITMSAVTVIVGVGAPFEIPHDIVFLVLVFVVDLVVAFRIRKESRSNNAMNSFFTLAGRRGKCDIKIITLPVR